MKCPNHSVHRRWAHTHLMVTILFVLSGTLSYPCWAAPPKPSPFTPPPPVSGRSLAEPDSLTLADVLSRTQLLREHLRIIRLHTGRPPPDRTLLQVEGASPREVFIQTYGLVYRAQQLGFEYLSLPIPPLPRPAQNQVTTAMNLSLLNQGLEIILRLRHHLGIKEAVSEPLVHTEPSASDVFNTIVAATHELNTILDSQHHDRQIYQIITFGLHIASAISSKTSRRFRPKTPTFVPNQSTSDVYKVLLECFAEIERIAHEHDLKILQFSLAPELIQQATTNQTMELSVLVASELLFLHKSLLGVETNIRSYYSGRKFPSHSVQRATLLKATLQNISAERRPR